MHRVVEANPRTMYALPESEAIAAYLVRGGAALLMYDIDFPVEPRLAAVLAASIIVALATHGRRPDPGLRRFEVAGVMLHLAPERVVAVEVVAEDRRWHFTRPSSGPWVVADSASLVPEEMASRLDRGLRLLHASAPQRVLQPEELVGIPLAAFGLDPPHYMVTVQGTTTAPFTVQLGGLNPQGLAQYVRVAGRQEVVLLPRFVGEQWEAVTGGR